MAPQFRMASSLNDRGGEKGSNYSSTLMMEGLMQRDAKAENNIEDLRLQGDNLV